MLDGPVPEGARSVSWPWYHHVLTDELTMEARALFEQYAKVPSDDVENHIYRIVSSNPHTTINYSLADCFCRGTKLGASFLGLALENFGSSASALLSTHSITTLSFHV